MVFKVGVLCYLAAILGSVSNRPVSNWEYVMITVVILLSEHKPKIKDNE